MNNFVAFNYSNQAICAFQVTQSSHSKFSALRAFFACRNKSAPIYRNTVYIQVYRKNNSIYTYNLYV